MSEDNSELDTLQHEREQVVQAFQKFVDRGFDHPDDLPLNDPEFKLADKYLDEWTEQRETLAKKIGTTEADLEFSLARSTVFVDAGFSDPDYLDEVAHDWLAQDLQNAEDAGLSEIATKIKTKISEIETKLTK